MNRLFLSLLITIGIIGFFGGGGYLLFENVKLKEKQAINEKEIKDLKYENKRLRRNIVAQNNKIKNYRRNIKPRNNIRASTNYKQRTKPKKKQNKEKIEYIYNGGHPDNIMSSNYKQTQNKINHKKKENISKI